jgi:hypothetical protein
VQGAIGLDERVFGAATEMSSMTKPPAPLPIAAWQVTGCVMAAQ